MKISVEVDGLQDVRRALLRVDDKVSLKLIRGALRFGMKPAIKRAKQLVPFDDSAAADDYSLRDSIGIRAERKKSRAGNATIMRFGAQRVTADADDTSGYAIKGGLGKSTRSPIYDQLIHKETPFLMDALEQTQGEVVRRFGTKITESVKKL